MTVPCNRMMHLVLSRVQAPALLPASKVHYLHMHVRLAGDCTHQQACTYVGPYLEIGLASAHRSTLQYLRGNANCVSAHLQPLWSHKSMRGQ